MKLSKTIINSICHIHIVFFKKKNSKILLIYTGESNFFYGFSGFFLRFSYLNIKKYLG